MESRSVASILGGAIGDAIGVYQETFPCSNDIDATHERVLKLRRSMVSPQTGYRSGGPWTKQGLTMKAGEWTDDTAMMLCLADSIMATRTVAVGDLLSRFVSWWNTGYNSSQGSAVGLGGNIRKAIMSFDPRDPDRLIGGTDPQKDAGNGSLMRLAPVPVYWHNDLQTALSMARLQTATTHNVQECLDGSALMAFLIWNAINGVPKETIFAGLHECPGLVHPGIVELASPAAAWRSKQADDIRTLPGRCLWSLEAALWCVYNTGTFKDAVVKAVNLAGDADTVGSITGQIAGALYGEEAVPRSWLSGLRHGANIVQRARSLYNNEDYDNDKHRITYA